MESFIALLPRRDSKWWYALALLLPGSFLALPMLALLRFWAHYQSRTLPHLNRSAKAGPAPMVHTGAQT
jgi:hypothetical protein